MIKHLTLLKNRSLFLVIGLMSFVQAKTVDKIEVLNIDIISYENLVNEDEETQKVLSKALYENGIVGVKGIPGYREKVDTIIGRSQEFFSLDEDTKEQYAPRKDDIFRGYERGKESYSRGDKRIIDDLKCSFYAFVPDGSYNIWPREMDLQTSFEDIGNLIAGVGTLILEKLELIGPKTGVYLDLERAPRLGRLLYYQKSEGSEKDNPNWAGAHFDHSLFTALLPAFYYQDGKRVPEPIEAGLFIKSKQDGVFRKVVANDHDVLMFQVGEFGQLISNDAIRATKHKVCKAKGSIDRYTLAVFTNPPMDTVVHSTSVLTEDFRYGGKAGDPCSYEQWNEATFKLFLVREEK